MVQQRASGASLKARSADRGKGANVVGCVSGRWEGGPTLLRYVEGDSRTANIRVKHLENGLLITAGHKKECSGQRRIFAGPFLAYFLRHLPG